jgi:hypothetical protein
MAAQVLRGRHDAVSVLAMPAVAALEIDHSRRHSRAAAVAP